MQQPGALSAAERIAHAAVHRRSRDAPAEGASERDIDRAVHAARANVRASTVNGSLYLTLSSATPDVRASSVNGAIQVTLDGAFSGHVSTSTVNGHVSNPFGNGDGPGLLHLSTVNGSITLRRG